MKAFLAGTGRQDAWTRKSWPHSSPALPVKLYVA